MQIIIVGCGKVGSTIAEQLSAEGHDITIVDTDEAVVKALAARLDIMGVTGNGRNRRFRSFDCSYRIG